MLQSCLEYYGINTIYPLYRLQELAFYHHPSGYKNENSSLFSLTYDQLYKLLHIKNIDILQETFRYGAAFGLVSNVIISPEHIEWSYNPFHQRDLFFYKLKLELRNTSKISSI